MNFGNADQGLQDIPPRFVPHRVKRREAGSYHQRLGIEERSVQIEDDTAKGHQSPDAANTASMTGAIRRAQWRWASGVAITSFLSSIRILGRPWASACLSTESHGRCPL